MNRHSDRIVRRARSFLKLDLDASKSKPHEMAEEHGEGELAAVFPIKDAEQTKLYETLSFLVAEPMTAPGLERAIDEVILKFDEARHECESAENARDESKWKGEMIAYANVVALLEQMKYGATTHAR